jgi:hypothetical protein
VRDQPEVLRDGAGEQSSVPVGKCGGADGAGGDGESGEVRDSAGDRLPGGIPELDGVRSMAGSAASTAGVGRMNEQGDGGGVMGGMVQIPAVSVMPRRGGQTKE